jgi:hypothetical protein
MAQLESQLKELRLIPELESQSDRLSAVGVHGRCEEARSSIKAKPA